MTNFSKTALLSKAEQFVKKGDYSNCFTTLLSVGVDYFFDLLTERISQKKDEPDLKGPLYNSGANRYFWQVFINSGEISIDAVVNYTGAFNLFKYYFKDERNINLQLLRFLADNHPKAFIQFIRTNEAFINEQHFASFEFLKTHDNPYLKLHYQCFVFFRDIKKSFDAREENVATALKTCEFWDGFIRMNYYLERKSFEDIDYYFLQLAGGAFMATLKWNQSLTNKPLHKLNPEKYAQLQEVHFRMALADEVKYFEHPFIEAFQFVFEYHYFYNNLLVEYCYNLNEEPRETKYGSVELDFVDYAEQYNWKINGKMYDAIWEDYEKKSRILVTAEIKKGLFKPKAENEFQYQAAVNIGIEIRACSLMLDELKIKSIKIDSKTIVTADEVLCTYYPFISWGKSIRQVDYKYEYGNWLQYIAMLFEVNRLSGSIAVPVRVDEKDSFINAMKEEAGGDSNYETIVPLFVNRFDDSGSKSFSPYTQLEDLFVKPIIEICGYYYIPTIMLEGSHPFNNILIALTDIYEHERTPLIKDENTELEAEIANRINEIGISQTGHSIEYFSTEGKRKRLGDIDVCFLLNGTLYLLELKRTKYRLNDKQRWIEKEGLIKKAANQLNRAEKYIKENPSFLKDEGFSIDTSTIPVKKIICTTSPEYRTMVVNDCEVISMQELILMVGFRIPVTKGKNGFAMFTDYLENGGFLLQLPIHQMEIRQTPLFTTNQSACSRYFDNFNAAKDYYNNRKIHDAIKSWKECLATDDKDVTVWGALGNCYADLKDYPTAMYYFNHALELQPGDYFVLANRGIAYKEMDNYVAYFTDMVQVMKIYKTGKLFLKNTFITFMNEGKLNPEEIMVIGNMVGLQI